ncbi:hypothetical protein [Streptomyces sp. NPDC046685]|uniref:hypothetical protein n=1 Tax=Streptomyces sp. NPDC046685 TaxID=3157202 RepID=UPI00340C46C3
MSAAVTAAAAPTVTELAEQVRKPVRATLAARADRLRAELPPRPESGPGRYTWWRSLDPEQARRGALLDRLEALLSHLDGRPAPGFDPADLLPAAALEEAEGFDPAETRMIAHYRAAANPLAS